VISAGDQTISLCNLIFRKFSDSYFFQFINLFEQYNLLNSIQKTNLTIIQTHVNYRKAI
jgi:hypothetical protein